MRAGQELVLPSPWLNAAGFCGFKPGGWPLPEAQGMFFTNPTTLKPRPFAAAGWIRPQPGGFLMSDGNANPGLAAVMKANADLWRTGKTPVCVHIRPEDPDQAGQMARMIEAYECAAAIEMECPPACSPEEMPAFWRAAAGELPLIARLPVGLFGARLAVEMVSAGAAAVSLGAPFGRARDENGLIMSGRLYGPAVLPLVLAAIALWKENGMTVIAGGGIFRKTDAEAALAVGAAAVQLDPVLWRPGGWVEDIV